jgi:5-methylcytosine-specific restriction endonuclease McrA
MARLKTIGPSVAPVSTAVAAQLPKMVDSFYHSPEWSALRQACLKRDRYTCQVALPGCEGRANIADHIVSRRNGGPDVLSNLRAVCRTCDNRVKEDALGRRRGSGQG